MSEPLASAIERVTNEESFYWAYLDVGDDDPTQSHEVEIRIDVPLNAVSSLHALPLWQVARDDVDGVVYLRRRQPLTVEAVRALLVEAVRLAYEHGGRFHSWMHAPDLADR